MKPIRLEADDKVFPSPHDHGERKTSKAKPQIVG
jgi:hypothetical protein